LGRIPMILNFCSMMLRKKKRYFICVTIVKKLAIAFRLINKFTPALLNTVKLELSIVSISGS
jgi:hypothetical protein